MPTFLLLSSPTLAPDQVSTNQPPLSRVDASRFHRTVEELSAVKVIRLIFEAKLAYILKKSFILLRHIDEELRCCYPFLPVSCVLNLVRLVLTLNIPPGQLTLTHLHTKVANRLKVVPARKGPSFVSINTGIAACSTEACILLRLDMLCFPVRVLP